MNGIKTIIKKELARVFGDRKLVFSLFIMPALLMLVLYSIMGKAMGSMVDDIETHEPTVYVHNAPEDFEALLNSGELEKAGIVQSNVTYYTGTENLDAEKEEIRSGNADLILVFPENFSDSIASYSAGAEIPEIKTYYNPSEDYSSEARNSYGEQVLAAYRQCLLAERFQDMDSLTVFQVDLDSESSVIMDESKAGGKMLAMMLPYLIVMLLFTGPMSLGTDAITGEKERGTMASMLVAPVKRSEIVIGKIISLSILSCLSAIVYAVSVIISVPRMFSGIDAEGLSMGASFTVVQMLELLVVMLSLVYFYVSIVVLISVFARTAKEAGTYISPIYIIVIVAGVLTMFSGNGEIKLPMFAIPVYGSAATIQRIITSELTVPQLGVTLLGTILCSVVLTALITKAFNSEKIMFNA